MAETYKGIEIPENDADRVKAVRSYEILETPPEQQYDDITELAAHITGCAVAYISIFDDARSWLKSSYGLPPNRPPRPREFSMCAPTICQSELLVVEDMSRNPRYASLPAVANPPHARFYCAMPLINRDGFALGTLCVWSPEQVTLDDGQREAFERLARLVLSNLEQRRDLLEAGQTLATAEKRTERTRVALERAEQVTRRLLPSAMAVRLMSNAEVPPRRYENVSVIHIDLEGFPKDADRLDPAELIGHLDAYFGLFDEIIGRHGLEKIRTSGSSYLAAAGLPRTADDHAARAVDAAREIRDSVEALSTQRRKPGETCWSVRIGIHSAPVTSGIIGGSRIAHDVWGEGVSVAHELCHAAAAGDVNLSETTRDLAEVQRNL